MTTPNPWIRYGDVLTIIEKITDTSRNGKSSAQSNREWFYWDGVGEAARAMSTSIADLAVTTPQPPTAEMVEARTLGWVLDRIDMMIDDLSDPDEQAQADKLLGLKALRAELRDEQRKLLGG
jgi:hypothetical protein